MWLFTKMFFKLYQQIGDVTIFIGVIALPGFDSEELISNMEGLDEEGYSFIPTTLNAYTDFKMHQDMGDITKFKDLQIENIIC